MYFPTLLNFNIDVSLAVLLPAGSIGLLTSITKIIPL